VVACRRLRSVSTLGTETLPTPAGLKLNKQSISRYWHLISSTSIHIDSAAAFHTASRQAGDVDKETRTNGDGDGDGDNIFVALGRRR